MQKPAGDGALIPSGGRNDGHHSIVSEMIALIEHVQTSMGLLEAALARESAPGNQEVAADIVVLDDVTPCYVKANAALSDCKARLGLTLHLLLDTSTSGQGSDRSAHGGHRPVGFAGHA